MSRRSLAFTTSLCRGPGRPCTLGSPMSAVLLLALAQLALTPVRAKDFLKHDYSKDFQKAEEEERQRIAQEKAQAEAGDVIVLNQGNFEAAIAKNPIMLVKFFAPWCGHCRVFAPTFAKVATRLKDTKPPIACGQVDVPKEQNLSKAFNIKGFPTVLAFVHGQSKKLEGGRDEESIVKFAQRWAPPLAEYLPDVAAAQAFEKDRPLIIVAAFEDPRKKAGDKELATQSDKDSFDGNFKQLCRHSKFEREVSFAYTSDPEVALRYSLGHPPSLARVCRQCSEGTADADHLMAYKGSVTSYADMEEWVRYSQTPAVTEFSGEIKPDMLLFDSRATLFLFRYRDERGLAAEQVVRSASGALSRRVNVVLMEPQGPDGRDVLQKTGLAVEAGVIEPAFWLYKQGSESYMLHGDEQSVESISAFVDDFMAGRLSPFNQAIAHQEV